MLPHQFRDNAPLSAQKQLWKENDAPFPKQQSSPKRKGWGGGGGADQCVTGRKDFCHSVMSTFMSQAREILDSIVFNNLFPQQECECPTYSFLQATTPCPRMDQEG